jgi:hypothetical protein
MPIGMFRILGASTVPIVISFVVFGLPHRGGDGVDPPAATVGCDLRRRLTAAGCQLLTDARLLLANAEAARHRVAQAAAGTVTFTGSAVRVLHRSASFREMACSILAFC